MTSSGPIPIDLDRESAAAWDVSFWYAAHTSSNHEKRVAELLQQRRIEHFLPLYEAVHKWTDRRVRVRLPLFRGYVFVRLRQAERLRTLQVPGVVRLIGFGNKPAPISDYEIEALRTGLNGQLKMRPHPYLSGGCEVRVLRGPLAGLEGILLRRKGNARLVLSLDLIARSVVVDIDERDICPFEMRSNWEVVETQCEKQGPD